MPNPLEMMKIASEFRKFQANHPKFVEFLKYAGQKKIEEGTIIEISIEKPGEEKVCSNMRIKKEDLEMFETLKAMSHK